MLGTFKRKFKLNGEDLECFIKEGFSPRYFHVVMDDGREIYIQRFIENGKSWMAKYDESIFSDGSTKILPEEITTQVLEFLNSEHPIKHIAY